MNPTAALLLIGDELLSGRTADRNLNHIAVKLSEIGVLLKESRVIPDDADMIVDAVTALKEKYTYVFTTGGIGPTHDDITASCIAKVFDVPIVRDPETVAAFKAHYGDRATPATFKMAEFPEGAELVANPVSIAPGFRMGNVYSFAGVPRIMQVMLEGVLPQLTHGAVVHSLDVDVYAGESVVSSALARVQKHYSMVDLGSYPFRDDHGSASTNLVARSSDVAQLDKAFSEIIGFLDEMNIRYQK